MAEALHHGAQLKKARKLNPDTARALITESLQRMFAENGVLPASGIRDFIKRWLVGKKVEISPTSYDRYEGALERFQEWLGDRAERDLATLDAATVQAFRDQTASEVSRASAVLLLKVIRTMLADAHRQGLVTQNAAALVRRLKTPSTSTRREFTLEEIKKILIAAKGSEFEGLVMVALYSGLRLGDCATLQWSNVDLEAREIRRVAGKTGKPLNLPLAKPLATYLLALPSSDDPEAPVFPKAAELGSRKLSAEFHKILVRASLLLPRSHHTVKGVGRDGHREVSPLSFHSLRHSFVTILKSTGASDAVAQELAGHESAAVSKIYTHMGRDVLRDAVGRFPDVTVKDEGRKGKQRKKRRVAKHALPEMAEGTK